MQTFFNVKLTNPKAINYNFCEIRERFKWIWNVHLACNDMGFIPSYHSISEFACTHSNLVCIIYKVLMYKFFVTINFALRFEEQKNRNVFMLLNPLVWSIYPSQQLLNINNKFDCDDETTNEAAKWSTEKLTTIKCVWLTLMKTQSTKNKK